MKEKSSSNQRGSNKNRGKRRPPLKRKEGICKETQRTKNFKN